MDAIAAPIRSSLLADTRTGRADTGSGHGGRTAGGSQAGRLGSGKSARTGRRKRGSCREEESVPTPGEVRIDSPSWPGEELQGHDVDLSVRREREGSVASSTDTGAEREEGGGQRGRVGAALCVPGRGRCPLRPGGGACPATPRSWGPRCLRTGACTTGADTGGHGGVGAGWEGRRTGKKRSGCGSGKRRRRSRLRGLCFGSGYTTEDSRAGIGRQSGRDRRAAGRHSEAAAKAKRRRRSGAASRLRGPACG